VTDPAPLGRYQRVLLRVIGTPFARRVFGPHVFTYLDRWVIRLTGGRLTAAGPPVFPTLNLITTGARTGQRRTVPLIYAPDGDAYVVVATNWGRERHPAWSVNLLKHPDAIVQTKHGRVAVRARLASEMERDAMWPRLLRTMPAWDDYRRSLDREVRVFVLEPVAAAGAAAKIGLDQASPPSRWTTRT
jgi:deazaflavin-dependent oxidoreductase (nitroreductase family)